MAKSKVKQLEKIGQCPCGNVYGKVDGTKGWYSETGWKKLKIKAQAASESPRPTLTKVDGDDEDEEESDESDEDGGWL